MTDTEAKALALVNEVFMERCLVPDTYTNRAGNPYHEALCRAIEREAAAEARHAAELRELKERFSEVLATIRRDAVPEWNHSAFDELATPFILPAPDPLVEAIRAMALSDATQNDADRLRAALAARGYQVTKIGEAGE